jgi:hypothetical protein
MTKGLMNEGPHTNTFEAVERPSNIFQSTILLAQGVGLPSRGFRTHPSTVLTDQ